MLLTLPDQANRDRFDIAAAAADHDQDGGWMISFVDILMLLLTLFVLLLAFHAVNQPAASAQPQPSPAVAAAQTAPEAAQKPQPPAPVRPQPASEPQSRATAPPPIALPLLALSEPQSTDALLSALQPHAPEPQAAPEPVPTPAAKPAFYVPQAVRDHVEIAISADAVNLIIKDDVLFDRASAELKSDGHRVLDGIVAILSQNRYAVSVEGHTDDTPIHTARFPSNWDLSVARATHVTRYLIEHGIARERLRAVGYADTRPLDTAGTPEARAHNRRVSLVVHVQKARPSDVAQQTLDVPAEPGA